MGHIEKVSSKKIIDHKHEIISRLNPDQVKELEAKMMQMVLQSQAANYQPQRVPEKTTAQKALSAGKDRSIIDATIIETIEAEESK